MKFGETTEEIDKTLFQLAHEENEISVAQWIYEFICTSLPVRITHENGECDQNMLKELQHYLVSDVNIKESDDKQESNSEDDNDEPIDPRWAALKGLRDKNN